jgi:hypothetical protein
LSKAFAQYMALQSNHNHRKKSRLVTLITLQSSLRVTQWSQTYLNVGVIRPFSMVNASGDNAILRACS